jgi:negative regulator of sigma E activity
MKSENIDELLNGFVDGELSPRQLTEVQRLIAHDMRILERLQQLQKGRILLNSLPVEQAPADMPDRVRTALEKNTLLGQYAEQYKQIRGTRHLFARKLATVAAMVSLVAVLAVVIYTIIAPAPVPHEPITRTLPPDEIVAPVMLTADEKSIPPTAPIESSLNVEIELRTDNPNAVNAAIANALNENMLQEQWLLEISQDHKATYTLNVGRENLSHFLADIQNSFRGLKNATLYLDTERFNEKIIVENVTISQVAEIIKQADTEKAVRLAADFARLNKIDAALPGAETFAAIDNTYPDFISIPKPVLTSGEKTVRKSAAQIRDDRKIQLKIVVAEGK